MKINWSEVERTFGIHSKIVDECKDTDYDVDGGFWDNISDWFWGEDFDYKSVDKAVGNFYNCCTIMYRVCKSIKKISYFVSFIFTFCKIHNFFEFSIFQAFQMRFS